MFSAFSSKYYKLKYRLIHSFHFRVRKNECLLEKDLLASNKTRWLDLGSSINDKNANFHFADLYPIEDCPENMKSKYYQVDFSKALNDETKSRLGKFHFIRMQHVFEHFTFEQASFVLDNCHELLEDHGLLLISVPDLDIYIKRYKNRTLKEIPSFGPWAKTRIEENAPESDYFSIYAHSMLHEKHLWCYNKTGLIHKIESSGKFKDAKRLGLLNKYSGIPFTHNRLEEDLCVIAAKK